MRCHKDFYSINWDKANIVTTSGRHQPAADHSRKSTKPDSIHPAHDHGRGGLPIHSSHLWNEGLELTSVCFSQNYICVWGFTWWQSANSQQQILSRNPFNRMKAFWKGRLGRLEKISGASCVCTSGCLACRALQEAWEFVFCKPRVPLGGIFLIFHPKCCERPWNNCYGTNGETWLQR